MKPNWQIIAEGEIGVKEVRGKKHNPRILEYFGATSNISRGFLRLRGDEIAWCSAFCCWVMEQAGYVSPRHALASKWLKWGFEAPLWTPGSIVVIKSWDGLARPQLTATGNHVGILRRVIFEDDELTTPKAVELVGGNQRNRVKVSRYPLDRWYVRGARLPFEFDDALALAA